MNYFLTLLIYFTTIKNVKKFNTKKHIDEWQNRFIILVNLTIELTNLKSYDYFNKDVNYYINISDKINEIYKEILHLKRTRPNDKDYLYLKKLILSKDFSTYIIEDTEYKERISHLFNLIDSKTVLSEENLRFYLRKYFQKVLKTKVDPMMSLEEYILYISSKRKEIRDSFLQKLQTGNTNYILNKDINLLNEIEYSLFLFEKKEIYRYDHIKFTNDLKVEKYGKLKKIKVRQNYKDLPDNISILKDIFLFSGYKQFQVKF